MTKLDSVNPWYEKRAKDWNQRQLEKKLNPLAVQTPVVSRKENKSVQSKDGYIYVPELGFYVAKEISYLGNSWDQCQLSLNCENAKMLNLNEMREFLKYAKEYQPELYNELVQVKSQFRSEWIDAEFKMHGGNLYFHCHMFNSFGKIQKIEDKLEGNTLMENRRISLDDWLTKSYTKQGLPLSNIVSGDCYYQAPMKDNNSVAGLGANSAWADLGCDGDPSGRYSNLGVRKCFVRVEDIK